MKTKMIFITCWMGILFAGLNSNLFAVLLPQAIADIAATEDRATISQYGSYVLSSFLMGWMLGGILLGYASDRCGRVKTMATAIALYALFTATAALSECLWQLLVCRFFTGVGVGGAMLGISIFLSEACPSRSRAMALGILVTSYQAGVFLSGVIAHLLPEWRAAFAAGLLPIIVTGIMLRYFSEPEEWVMRKETHSQLDVGAIIKGSFLFGSLLVGYWASLFWVPTWIQDLLGSSATGNEKTIDTLWHGLGATLGCIIAGPCADRFGRRPIILLAFLGAFTTSWTMFLGYSQFHPSLYVAHSLLGIFIGMAQATLYIYLPELFPASSRATSVGWCLNGGRLVTALSVLFVGLFVSFFGGYREALSAFAFLYLVGVGFTWFAPETLQRSTS